MTWFVGSVTNVGVSANDGALSRIDSLPGLEIFLIPEYETALACCPISLSLLINTY